MAPAQADALYGKSIHIPANASDSLKGSAATLAQWLKRVTKAEFTVGGAPSEAGITLVHADDTTLPVTDMSGLKKHDSPEAFLLFSNDADHLWMVGKSDLALERGV